MDFEHIIKRAKEIREVNAKLASNEGSKPWGLEQRMEGFVGDVGKLAQLVMAKNGYRKYDNVDQKLAHELADCLWSVIIVADEAGVDIEKAFVTTMDEIEARLQ